MPSIEWLVFVSIFKDDSPSVRLARQGHPFETLRFDETPVCEECFDDDDRRRTNEHVRCLFRSQPMLTLHLLFDIAHGIEHTSLMSCSRKSKCDGVIFWRVFFKHRLRKTLDAHVLVVTTDVDSPSSSSSVDHRCDQ
jgi:hypothetical protein